MTTGLFPTVVPATRGAAPAVRVVGTVEEFSAALDLARSLGQVVGLVPTMGALHAGHRSLIERAAAECDVVAVTIFVNPLQFGETSDIEHYPRTFDADVAVAGDSGAAVVFAPSVEEMYPGFPAVVATSVSVAGVSDGWEGSSRPGHFDGVATVVAKLFAMAGRCRAYFGEKDFQQLAVVRRMARDLSFPVEIVGCDTVRDTDGLALSSRNVRLSADERTAATVLSRALRAGAAAMARSGTSVEEVEGCMARVVAGEPSVALDYAAVVRSDDLSRPGSLDGPGPFRLLIAAQVGPVRLIDNLDPAPPAVPVGAMRSADDGEGTV
jgi:pantoate--beta-alanine ligase